MGNENSTSDHQEDTGSHNTILWPPNPVPPQRTSSVQNPGALQLAGNSDSLQKKQGDSIGTGAGSTGLGGSCSASSASESAASLDPSTVSPEVTEPGRHPQESKRPEGSPLPSSSLPWEQVCPLASMPFTECPPEGCLASSEAAPEDGTLAHHPRREASPSIQGDALATFSPEGDGSTKHTLVATTPSVEEDEELKKGRPNLSSSCTGQLPEISLMPPHESRTEQLCAEGDWPGSFETQEKDHVGDCLPEESATKAPAATKLGMESTDVLEESPWTETMVPQDPVLRSADRDGGGMEGLPTNSAKNLEFLGGCHPSKSNSGTKPGAGTNTGSQVHCQQEVETHLPQAEPPSDPLGFATAPGDSGSWKETQRDTSNVQSQPQTGTSGTEPQQVVCVTSGNQPDRSLLGGTEAPPFTRTEETHTASSPTPHPDAWDSVILEEASLTKETDSEAKMPVSADLATGKVDTGVVGLKRASDLRRTQQQQPEGSLQGVPTPFLQGQNDTVLEELLLPTLSHGVSNESSRKSMEPTDGPKAPKNTENRVVAIEESRSPRGNPKRQQEATRALDGAQCGNHEEERSHPFHSELHLETDKDEVSKPHSEPSNSDSAQPPRQAVAGHEDGPHAGSAEAVGQVITDSHTTDTCISLHKVPEQGLILSSASDGTGEHFPLQEAIWGSSGSQTKSPSMLQGRGELGTTESLPALDSEKSDFLSAPAVEEVPKAGEVESVWEIKQRHSPLQRPYSCDGEGLLISPGQPCGLKKVESGQEVHTDVSSPHSGKSSTMGHGPMLSLKQECQGKLSCPGDSLPLPSENPLQPSQLDPEAAVFAVLCEKAQSPANGQGACPSGPGLKKQGANPSPILAPMEGESWVGVNLPTQGGKEQASELPPKGSRCSTPSSSPEDTDLGKAPSEESDPSTSLGQTLPALGINEQEGTGCDSQPSEILHPAEDTSLTGNLGGKDSCGIRQELSKSQQELADALKAGSQHEEARCGDSGVSDVCDVLPLPQGLGKTEAASRGIVEAPPCPPDSKALLDTAYCSPVPEPTSPRGTPTPDALESEACDENQEELAPHLEMEQLATLGAEAQGPLGSVPRAEEQHGGSAEVNVGASEGDPGMQQDPGGPQAALHGGSFQSEQCLTSWKEAYTSTLTELCQLEQLVPSCGDPLLPAGEPTEAAAGWTT
ncbi:transforming acidic coiled-coil-containing protein 2-like [Phodopus roborovskii]|uniref:transforming acidic coiled-coil-containing protein 2-like n=1 Tax=Phodopus roborovskii TaxID=109678 RepID=UPI0021E3DA1B|nr:transforming acidic coiled-coil-containing protein 2-like [Phodopus roborovskii]